MTDQSRKTIREAQDAREMAAEISRLRSVVSMLLGEKHKLKQELQASSEIHNMISRLHEQDQQFKDALRNTLGVLKTAITNLEGLIDQDPEPVPDRRPRGLSVPASQHDESVDAIPSGLRVVSEGHYRWRQMRQLSDGTIEVDTPAGRLRFVDQLHVDEYFDAHWPISKK